MYHRYIYCNKPVHIVGVEVLSIITVMGAIQPLDGGAGGVAGEGGVGGQHGGALQRGGARGHAHGIIQCSRSDENRPFFNFQQMYTNK